MIYVFHYNTAYKICQYFPFLNLLSLVTEFVAIYVIFTYWFGIAAYAGIVQIHNMLLEFQSVRFLIKIFWYSLSSRVILKKVNRE